ncbi:MAG: autotransporter-associated beta strand repeat-containing protein [Verrucomicrobiota bacterium]
MFRVFLNLSCGMLAWAGLVATAPAQTTYVKANNNNALNTSGSYTTTGVPGPADTIQIDNTLTAAQYPYIGGNLSVNGINQLASTGYILTAGSGGTLSVGSGGITKAAAVNLLFNCPITLTANQTWSIAAGGSGPLQINGAFNDGGYNLNVIGAGSLNLWGGATNTFGTNVTVSCGIVVLNSAGAVATFSNPTNSFGTLSIFGGRFIATSVGLKGSNNAAGSAGTITLGLNATSSGVFEYGGNTSVATDRIFSRNVTSPASGINVTLSGVTLTVTNITQSGTPTASTSWNFGGAGNMTLCGPITNTGTTYATGVNKNDGGTFTLVATNTYSGPTVINGGTLALTGKSSISNSPLISVAGGATFDLSGLSSPFALQSSQTLSNSASATGALKGIINASRGAIAMTVNGTAPAFSIGSGTLIVSTGTVFQISSTIGAPGTYPLITKAAGGNVTGTVPPITLRRATGYLQITNGELDLVVQTSDVLNWYVSPTGSDANPGSIGAPLRTLAAATGQLFPGATLYLRAGTYRETLTPPSSGTSGMPITITAYSNEVATLSGCDLVTNTWSYTSNGIYVTSVGWDLGEGYNQVFVDGVLQHEAQYPDWTATNTLLTPALTPVVCSNNYTMSSSGYTNLGDVGGAIWLGGIKPAWAWQNGVISSNSGTVLYINSNSVTGWWWPNYYAPPPVSSTGFGCIYGKLNLLNADNEWFLDSATTNFYLRLTGGANPAGHTIELKRRNWCVDMNGQNYVVLRGLQTSAGAIQLDGFGEVLDSCTAAYLSHFLAFTFGGQNDGGRPEGGGVVITGSSNLITGCTIHDTSGSGIKFAAGNSTNNCITRCHIYNTDYSGTYASAVTFGGNYQTLSYCTIHESGRQLLGGSGAAHIILGNDMYGCGWLDSDLGIVYMGGPVSPPNGIKTRITYNWIHDGNQVLFGGYCNGIYLDNGTYNFKMDHNVCWNYATGGRCMLFNTPSQGHEVYHNTLFNGLSFDTGTDCGIPSTNILYNFTAENNLYLSTNSTTIATNLMNVATRDFRLRPGSGAINPLTTNYTVTWATTNGRTGMPAGFSMGPSWTNGWLFTFQETAGYGEVLPGMNDGYVGATPDNGAYESGGPYWQPGTNGWAVSQPAVQNNGAAVRTSNVVLQGTLISAGLPSANVQVFWGSGDGGTNVAGWLNQTNLGTFTGSFVSLSNKLSGAVVGTSVTFRFYATNATGVAWSGSQVAQMPEPWPPTNLIFSVSSNRLTLSWPANYLGWSLQVQTNSLSTGLGTNWFTVPGSSLVTTTNVPLAATNPSVFYRLIYQP